MTIQDFLLGFGIAAVVLLSIPVIAIGIAVADPDPTYSRISWETGRPFVSIWFLGWLCLAAWALLEVL